MAGRMSTSVMTEPEHLTKEKLKQELDRFDIPYEPNEKKQYYVNLYKRTIMISKKPVRRARGEFSSDEDIRFKKPAAPVGRKVYSKKVSHDTYLEQVKKFSDAELASELRKYDSRVGPVVDSTRAVYQRKLASLMSDRLRKAAVDHRGEEQVDNEESYSDESEHQSSEEEEEESVDYEPLKSATSPKLASNYSHLVAPASFSPPSRHQEYRDYYEEPVKAKEAELPSISPQYDLKSRSPSYDKISEGRLRQEYRSKKELHIPKHSPTHQPQQQQQQSRVLKKSMCNKILLLQFVLAFLVAFFSYILYTAPEYLPQLKDRVQFWLGLQ